MKTQLFIIFYLFSGLDSYPKIQSPCLCQEFRCEGGDNSFCLHKSKVCNGYKDCPGGEDELHLEGPCSKNASSCKEESFKCKFGGCIPINKVCDGNVDCHGAVDEASDFCLFIHS